MTQDYNTSSLRDSRRHFLKVSAIGSALLLGKQGTGIGAAAAKSKWPVGHHFYNWDHAWNKAEFLDIRLRLTRDTGWDGFEAKPEEMGVSAEELKDKCTQYGVKCAAIGGGGTRGIDYAHAAGAHVLRGGVSVQECKRMVDYAAERDVIIVVHSHIGSPGKEGPPNIETREDMLRYLDERPGVYGCPDTAHLALCGSDPVQTIRDLGERCKYIHLKDLTAGMFGLHKNVPNKFPDLGKGALDLAGCLKALEDIKYDGWIMVERDDRVPDYEQSAREMRAYLRKAGY